MLMSFLMIGNEDTVGDWLVEHVEEMDSDVGFVLTTQAPRVRDLYDDDFESEDENIVDMEFEPDVFQENHVFHNLQPLQQGKLNALSVFSFSN